MADVIAKENPPLNIASYYPILTYQTHNLSTLIKPSLIH